MNTRAFVVVSKEETTVQQDWIQRDVGPKDVFVKISACGLNFADLLMIKREYQDTPPHPFSPGMEISGEILEVGSNVVGLVKGQRIAAFCGSGGLASHAVIPANRCLPLPDTMDDTTAAGFIIAYGTSHLALTRRARLTPGETLVVLGAAGGVGLTAVEIGKALGARVIGVARGREKQEVARAAGADSVHEADSDLLRSELKALAPINVVYDAVGGALGEAALRSLAPEGRFLAIGFASGAVPNVKVNHLLVKNVDVIGFYWGGYFAFAPELLLSSLNDLMAWHAEGRLKPHISHVLPFEQIENGLDLLRSRKATGKVVITL